MKPDEITLATSGIEKVFSARTIFTGITFSLSGGQSLGLTGRNGAGKSTLVKILAGVLSPTRGSVAITRHGINVPGSEVFRLIGFVAPYFQLYDEFTGLENLEFGERIRGVKRSGKDLEALLDRVNLLPRRDDLVRTYSSGMKQRLKYAFALLHEPPILILDEPASNLDRDGIAIMHEIVREQRDKGMTVIATNDQDDLQLCDSTVSVERPTTNAAREDAR